MDTSDMPLANAQKGTLAYYAPWGDVVMFYGDFGSAAGLYELGRVVAGSDDIASLSGTFSYWGSMRFASTIKPSAN